MLVIAELRWDHQTVPPLLGLSMCRGFLQCLERTCPTSEHSLGKKVGAPGPARVNDKNYKIVISTELYWPKQSSDSSHSAEWENILYLLTRDWQDYVAETYVQ